MLTEEYLVGLIGQEETQTLEFKSGRLFDENTEKIAGSTPSSEEAID